MTPLETVLDRLQKPRKSGKGWTACCPAHQDKSPSLAVSEGADGRVLLKCWAGCDYADIMASIGLSVADGFVKTHSTRRGPTRAAIMIEVNVVRCFEGLQAADAPICDDDRQRYQLAKSRLEAANAC